MVGVAGFEPATPWSRTRGATRLRKTPTKEHDPEKACPRFDPGWIAVFRKAHAPARSNGRAYTIRPAGLQAPGRIRYVVPIRKNACAPGLDPGAVLAIPKKIAPRQSARRCARRMS